MQNRDGSLETDSKIKANLLSEQYKSVFTEEDINQIPDKGASPYPIIKDLEITLPGIVKMLKNLDIKKAIGPDLVPTRTLKEYADIIAPMLHHLFSQSVRRGQVPDDWKRANVCAVFKKGDKTLSKNYRPVSLTCVTCKMLEHIITSHVMTHLDLYNILVNFQHGFRRNHSCESQLINTIEALARGLDNGEQIDVIILDFEKAFDTVPHQRLLHKMQYYGIGGDTHRWIAQWLTGRSQTVVVEGERSGDEPVISGVPQGTVLGPILFLVYINDIAEGIQSSARLFADDGLLYRSIASEQDAVDLQSDLDAVVEWSRVWQMRFNPTKCHLLRVTRKRKITPHTYCMLGQDLAAVKHYPYLGVEIDETLSWKTHVNKTCSKAHNSLNFLRRNLYRCPRKTKESAYQTMVRPLVEYCSSAWDPGYVGQIRQVEAVQRKAARFVTSDWGRYSSVTDMVKSLEWHTLQERRLVRRLSIFYQVLHGNTAVQLPNYVTQQNRPRPHPFQYSSIQASKLCYTDSFWPRTILSWNPLPLDIVSAKSVDHFKDSMWDALDAGSIKLASNRDPLARIRPHGQGPLILF